MNAVFGKLPDDLDVAKTPVPKGLKSVKNFWTAQTDLPAQVKTVLPHLVSVEFRAPLGPEILDHNNRLVHVGGGCIVQITKEEVRLFYVFAFYRIALALRL